MKKNDFLIIILFIMILTLPSILFWFLKDKMDLDNYEYRNLYQKPKLEFKNITKFPQNYENYFNDNVAFKNELRIFRSKVLYDIFNMSSNEKVIVGENGWLFYNSKINEDTDSILDYRNTFKFDESIKNVYMQILLNTKILLKERNVDLYILIVPNKENVYSDKLENIINRVDNSNSRIEDLIDYLRENTDLDIIYPKEQLILNRKINETYFKYDTHWNNYGGYVAIEELMKVIDDKFEMPKITITMKKGNGDLARMNLMPYITNDEPIITGFFDDISIYLEELPQYTLCSSDNAIYDKTVLVVGDSFMNTTKQYISKLYKKSIFVNRDDYNENYIKQFDVDIVIYESVERLAGELFNIEKLIYLD